MKIILTCLLCSVLLVAYSQKRCYIAINSSDCYVCQNSYNYISRIDRRLNPLLVLSISDSSSAEYFVKEHLKINDIDYIIDDVKYKSLVKDLFSLQICLFDSSKLLFQMPIKELSSRINELNTFANPSTKIVENNELKLDSINWIISKKFWGATSHFIIKDELVLYNELTRWVICANLKLNNSIGFKLEDSTLYESLKINHDNNKRSYYLSNVEGLNETYITSYCYYSEKLYLVIAALDYEKMKSGAEVTASNNEAELIHRVYIAKYGIVDGAIKLEDKLDITEDFNNNEVRHGFSVFNNKPVLYMKIKINSVDSYYCISLENNWEKTYSKQSKPNLMSEHILENVFFNAITYNYDNYTIINNESGKHKKIIPGTMLTTFMLSGGSLFVHNNNLYLNVLNRAAKTLYIYKVNLETAKLDIIKSLKEQDNYSFYPIFYHNKVDNKILVLDINNDKMLFVVCEIEL